MSRAHSASGQCPSSTDLHFENSFEDNGVAGQQVLDLLALEDDVFQRCLSAQPAPTVQRTNRGKCAHLLRDLAAAAAPLPALRSAAAGPDPQVVVGR